jgi:hypothetical protein
VLTYNRGYRDLDEVEGYGPEGEGLFMLTTVKEFVHLSL